MSLYRLKSKNLIKSKAALFFVLGTLLLTVAACSTTLAPELSLVVDPLATQALSAQAVATFEPTGCPFDVPEGAPLECGFVVVPEDHNVADGPAIRLAIVIVRDQSDDHQPDPVIVLAGGPGEKVVQSAIPLAQILAPLRAHRDLIIFDQRGVGLSEPALECPEFVSVQFDLLDETDPNRVVEENYHAIMACSRRLVSEGHNLSLYNTEQNAADVDAIRSALGYDQVNLYGGSYGSLLAQAVMRDYPETIRSVAINSVLPLQQSLFVEASVTTAQAILRLIDACRADEGCGNAYPDLQKVLFETIERLDEEPLALTITSPLDGRQYDALLSGDGIRANLVTFLYVTQIMPVLPQAVFNVHNGDYDLMTQLSSTRLALFDLTSRGMTFSVMCAEDLIGRTPQDLLDIMRTVPVPLQSQADADMITRYGIFGICADWPVEQAATSAKEPLVSDIPTLILAGEFDPVTPPEYGRLVAQNLVNSYFFELPGIGHNVLVASQCARSIVGAFVDDPTRAPDAGCMDEAPGLVFDLPLESTAIVLEPYTDAERAFSGLMPAGWQELSPAQSRRGNTALDPAYFVLEATPGTMADLFADVAAQMEVDPALEPVTRTELGSFTWTFYTFDRRGHPVDLAMAEEGGKAYFVFLLSPVDEHDVFYEQLFLPAVEAMTPLH